MTRPACGIHSRIKTEGAILGVSRSPAMIKVGTERAFNSLSNSGTAVQATAGGDIASVRGENSQGVSGGVAQAGAFSAPPQNPN